MIYEDIPEEDYDIPEDYYENPEEFQEEYEEDPEGMSWENNEIPKGIQGEDIKISQPKTEHCQDYTDPMAVCDIKLEKKEIGSDHDTKIGKDKKLKKKRKIVKPEPSQCTECGKTFKNKTNMTQHIKFVHEKAQYIY